MFSTSRIATALPLAAAVTLGLLALTAPTANAQNLLTNGSFEAGNFTGVNQAGAAATTQLQLGATNITGWTVIGGSDIAWENNGNPYGFNASDGVRSLDLTGYTDHAPYGGLSQALTLIQGGTYKLSFDIGTNASFSGTSPNSIRAIVGNLDQVFTFTPVAGGATQQYGTVTANFFATTAATTLQLIGASAGSPGQYIGLDNASVTFVSGAAAPEPGSVALLFTGVLPLVGMVARRRAVRA